MSSDIILKKVAVIELLMKKNKSKSLDLGQIEASLIAYYTSKAWEYKDPLFQAFQSIQRPKIVKKESETNDYICNICYDRVPESIIWRTPNCSMQFSQFCKPCVSNYLRNEILEGRVFENGCQCICRTCDFWFDETKLNFFSVEPEIIQKFITFRNNKKVMSDPLKRWCPNPSCSVVVNVVAGSRKAKCKACKTSFCTTCTASHSILRSCDSAADSEFRKWKNTTIQGCKRCPSCRLFIEKNEGCNHMTCIRCHHQFCWICNSNWDSGCKNKRICRFLQVAQSERWGSIPVLRQTNQVVAFTVVGGVALGVVGVGLGVAAAAAGAAVAIAVPAGIIGGSSYSIYRGYKKIKRKYSGKEEYVLESLAEEAKWGIRVVCPWSIDDPAYQEALQHCRLFGMQGRVQESIFVGYPKISLDGASPPFYFVPFDAPHETVHNTVNWEMIEINLPDTFRVANLDGNALFEEALAASIRNVYSNSSNGGRVLPSVRTQYSGELDEMLPVEYELRLEQQTVNLRRSSSF